MPISQIITAMLICGLLGMCVNPASPPAADLVLRNGKIATVDEARPTAQALAIRGDTIAAVGTDEELRRYVGPSTRVVDLHGMLAVPGFVESHAHFRGIGAAKMQLDLMPAKSWEEIVSAVEAAVRKASPGEWIVGRGWHQEKWVTKPEPNVEGFPLHPSLSLVSPDNPVLLTHASGHAVFANARAMKLAGVTAATPNPPGGEIVRDRTGNPIGVFRETASGLLERAHSAALSRRTPEQVKEHDRREVELAIRECLSKGITTFHDAGAAFSTVDLYREFADQDKLGLRLYVMLSEENPALAGGMDKYRMIGYGGGHLTVRAIKRYMDGALGSRGAWLLEPYARSARQRPASIPTPVSEIAETARLRIEHGLPAVRPRHRRPGQPRDAGHLRAGLQGAPGKEGPPLAHRARPAPQRGPTSRASARSASIAAMQGIHCTSDAPYVLARLGPARAEEGAYVWQKLMKTGGVVSQRHRRPGGGRRSDRRLLRHGDPQARRTARLSTRTSG